jgi:hypothetical protein
MARERARSSPIASAGRNGILADALYARATVSLQLAADKTRIGDPTNK